MSTSVDAPPAATPKKKRGRETALDMVRSLAVVFALVVPIWFLAQAPDSDEAEIRVVDPAQAVAAFAADVPSAPVPGSLPSGWRATSSTYEGAAGTLRVGWVTPEGQYAEYAASTGPREEFLEQIAGDDVERLEPVLVDGRPWQQLRQEDGSLSLTRSFGDATVVVGSQRATAGLAELEVLLGSLATR